MFVVKTPEQETEMFGISVSIIDFMHLMQIYGYNLIHLRGHTLQG